MLLTTRRRCGVESHVVEGLRVQVWRGHVGGHTGQEVKGRRTSGGEEQRLLSTTTTGRLTTLCGQDRTHRVNGRHGVLENRVSGLVLTVDTGYAFPD
jgi:hypothetical protein